MSLLLISRARVRRASGSLGPESFLESLVKLVGDLPALRFRWPIKAGEGVIDGGRDSF